jgi:hypothetical protein
MRKVSEVISGAIGSVEYIDFEDMVLVKDINGSPMFTAILSDAEIFDADEECLECDIPEDAVKQLIATIISILKQQDEM